MDTIVETTMAFGIVAESVQKKMKKRKIVKKKRENKSFGIGTDNGWH